MTVSMTTKILAGSALVLAFAGLNSAAARAQAPGDTPLPPMTAPVDAAPPAAPAAPAAEAAPGGTAANPDGSPPAAPASKKRNRFRIGPEVGVYLPTSSKTRRQFGDAWLTLGLGLGDIGRITAQGQTTFDLQVLYQSKNGNHAFLAPLGVGYRVAVSQSSSTTTYVGATADLILADLRSGDYNVHSGLRTGFGGSALVGVNFGNSGYLEARYLVTTQIKSFDLGGLNLTAGYRF